VSSGARGSNSAQGVIRGFVMSTSWDRRDVRNCRNDGHGGKRPGLVESIMFADRVYTSTVQ
jgi:hypothetical protein